MLLWLILAAGIAQVALGGQLELRYGWYGGVIGSVLPWLVVWLLTRLYPTIKHS